MSVSQYQLSQFSSALHAEKNIRNHHRISNGLTGYNGNCTGFNGNCNGACGSLLVIGCLLLVTPLNANGICPKTHYRKPFFYGFNG